LLGGVYSAVSICTFLAGLQVRGRLSGGFLSANSGATVFGVLMVIGTGFLIRQMRQTARLSRRERVRKLAVPAGSLFFMTVCLMLTASRMGLGATAMAICALLIWEFSSRRRIKLALRRQGLALLAGAALLVLVASIPLWGRIGQLDSDSSIRGQIFSTHWKAFLTSPVFGHGLGTFNDVNGQLITPENYSVLWLIRATHNVYIQWLEEAGLVGALPMFALIAVVILTAIHRVGRMKSGQTLARGLLASNLVVLIHGMTDYALQVPSIAAFWAFLLGLQFAFGQDKVEPDRERPGAKPTRRTP
jgi:O-antigen ligase